MYIFCYAWINNSILVAYNIMYHEPDRIPNASLHHTGAEGPVRRANPKRGPNTYAPPPT